MMSAPDSVPEMVERVARAMSGYAVHGEPGIPNNDRPMSSYEIGLARAAIEAMRQPTEAMAEEGFRYTGDPCWQKDVARAWRAMVDVSLGGPSSTLANGGQPLKPQGV